MTRTETERYISRVLGAAGVCLAQFPGPKNSRMEMWAVRSQVVVIRIMEKGGFDHWMPNRDRRLSAFEEDIQALRNGERS